MTKPIMKKYYKLLHAIQAVKSLAVTIHWTGLLDWNTGLDYWTEVFSFFGQNYVVFQIFDTWRPQLETIEFL